MKHKFFLLFIIFTSGFFPFVYAQAQELPVPPESAALQPLPESLQKTWVMAGCRKGKLAHSFSSYFVLTSIDNKSIIYRTQGAAQLSSDLYNINLLDGSARFVIGSKGDIFQLLDHTQASISIADLEDRKLFIPHVRYSLCADNIPDRIRINQSLLNLLPKLDKVHENCPLEGGINDNACRNALFLIFDQDNNSSLNKVEIQAAWDIIISNNNFSQCVAASNPSDMLMADGTGYTKWIFENLDKNKDEEISLMETVNHWPAVQADSYMAGAINFLISAAAPLQVLPQGVQLTCVNCCIATR